MMTSTLAVLKPNINNGVLEVLELKEGELIIKSNCPNDNDTMLGLAICIVNAEGRVIIVGDSYDRLSDKAKRFTYYHEVAHHLNGDIIATNTVQNEVDADMYSASMVSKMVAYESLTELIVLVEEYKARNKELNFRVEISKESSIEQLKYRRKQVFKRMSLSDKIKVIFNK